MQTLSELQVGPKAGINDGQRLAISLSATSPLSPSWFSCFDPPAFPPQAKPSMAVASVSHTGHTLSNARISWFLHGAATAASIQPFSGRALSESLRNGSRQPASSKMGSHPGNLPGTRTTAVGAPVAAHVRRNGPHGCARHPIQGCLPHLEAADEPEHQGAALSIWIRPCQRSRISGHGLP